MRNRYSGSCAECGIHVPADAGEAKKLHGRWVVYHLHCLSEPPQAVQAPQAREITADGRVTFPYDPDAVALVKGFPGARWNPDAKCWTVSLAIADRVRVLEVADRMGLAVAPELRVYQEDTETSAALARAEGLGLYPYQLDGVRFLAAHRQALLGDDMGLGKTVQTILSIPEGSGALVIGPKTLKANWRQEISKWRPSLRVRLADAKTLRPWPKAGEVVIVHYDAIRKIELTEADRQALQSTVLIVDEAHRVKGHKTQQAVAVRTLAEACGRTWLLTGTPLLTRPFDLMGVLTTGGLFKAVFGGFSTFLRCFDGHQSRWGYEFSGEVTPDTPERLRRVMLRRTKAEVLPDLPRKHRVDLTANDIGSKCERALNEAWARICNTSRTGMPDFEEFSAIRAMLAESRIPAMLEYIEDAEEQGNPLLVFSAHRKPIDTLATREGWAVITGSTDAEERQAIVDRFQRGELRGLGLTIAAGGVGLTLTRASTVLFVDLDWTPANNLQAEDRVCRIGQTADKIQIVQMISAHPADQHVQDLIVRKMELIEKAIEATIEYEAPAPIDTAAARAEWERARADWERVREESRVQAAAAAAQADMDQRHAAVSRRATMIDARGSEWRVELTAEQREKISVAWAQLLGVCDYAVEKDGVGFSKADVYLAHFAMPLVDSGDEEACQVAYQVLRKYHRQVGEI